MRATKAIATAVIAALFTSVEQPLFAQVGRVGEVPSNIGSPAAVPQMNAVGSNGLSLTGPSSLSMTPVLSDAVLLSPSIDAVGLPGAVSVQAKSLIPSAVSVAVSVPKALSPVSVAASKTSVNITPTAIAPKALVPQALAQVKRAASTGDEKAGDEKSDESAAKDGAQTFDGAAVQAAQTPVAAKESKLRSWLKSSKEKAAAFGKDVKGMATGDQRLEFVLGDKKDPGSSKYAMRKAQVLLVLDAVFMISMAFIVGPLLDSAGAGLVKPVLLLGAAMLGSSMAYALVERGHAYWSRLAGLRAARDYRNETHASMLKQDMDFHNEKTSGKLGGQLLNDPNYLSWKNVDTRLTLLHYSLHLAFGVTMMLVTSPALSVAALAVIPFLAWLTSRYGDVIATLGNKINDKKSDLTKKAQESLSQAETVKTFGSLEQEMERYARESDEMEAMQVQETRLMAKYNLIAGGLSEFFTKYLIYIIGGVALALAWGLSFGQITQLTLFAGFAKYAFSGLMSTYLRYKRYAGAAVNITDILLRKPAIVDADDAVALPRGEGRIEFKDVRFAYPMRKAEPVLKGVSFVAEPGKTVAFVGETGSGKSTITRLLLRLWDVDSGAVTVDGKDVRGVKRLSLMDQTAVVPQETRLFNGTMRQNMLYGSEDASEERLQAAIKKAGATFVFDESQFPQGLDTPVAEGGTRLSGGQRQRVAIVRALLREPSILILDEATSALDNKTEREIQASLDSLKDGASGRAPTTIVIAHRLSTIKRADAIHVLEKGVIVESGTHEELLRLGGRYARLWKEGGYDAPVAEIKADEAPAAAVAEAAAAPAKSEAAAEAAKTGVKARLAKWGKGLSGFAAQMKEWFGGDAESKPFVSNVKLAGAAFLSIAESASWIAASTFLGKFLTAAVAASAHPGAAVIPWPLIAASIGVVALAILISRWSTLAVGVMRAKALNKVRQAMMRKLHEMPLSFHLKEENSSSALASRLSEDPETYVKKFVDTRVPLAGYVVSLGLASGLLIAANPAAGVLLLVMLPVLGVINGYFGQKREKLYQTFGVRRAAVGKAGQEPLELIQTVKTFGREAQENARYRAATQALVETGELDAKAGANAHMLSSALTEFFTKNLIYILGALSVAGALSFLGTVPIGTVVVMTFYAGFIKAAFDGLSMQYLEFKNARGETQTMREWLRMELAPKGTTPLPEGGEGAVSFEDVGFTYSEDGTGAGISGLTLDIKPGETVAFVGESGSGKSTTFKLLQDLWTPKTGRVRLDGVAVNEAKPSDLTDAIAKVPQETRLFDDTLRYNMTYGTPGVTEEQLQAAIRAAKAEFVDDKEAFPQGLDTRVGEGGATLSGGQRQRVAIVRALLKKPRVLLLDEATSALDKKTEREIQATLDSLKDGVSGRKTTTLVVAHNLTTVSGADRIVVMDKGRVVEVGSHVELLAKGGAYARLWQSQQGR